MDLGLVALLFGVTFIAELPDKSLFATIVMSTRYPSLYVWLGTSSAFIVHVFIAVLAGHFLTLLPHTITELIIGTLFLLGAGLIFFGKHGLEETPDAKKLTEGQAHNPGKVFLTAFGVTFAAEFGDITQITTANYAAKYHDPLSVGLGAGLGLLVVAAVAIGLGSRVLTKVPGKLLQRITGCILLAFGIYSLVSIFR